ncbi:CDP-glycerol glycerophosphotransferase family protein [Cobetia marina]
MNQVSSPVSTIDDIEDNIVASLNGNILEISDDTKLRSITLNLDKLSGSNKVAFKLQLKKNEINRVLLVQDLSATNEILVVYTTKHSVICMRKLNNGSHPLKQFVKVKFKILYLSINKQNFSFVYIAAISNPYGLSISKTEIYLDDQNIFPIDVPIHLSFPKTKLKLLRLAKVKRISMQQLLCDGEPPINSHLKIRLEINDMATTYSAQTLKIHKPKNKRNYYVPISTCSYKDYAFHIRRTLNGTPTLVRRLKDPVEKTRQFKILESSLVSLSLYGAGKCVKYLSRKSCNVFFEKFAAKAEEGTYEIFCKSIQSNNSNNVFVISKESDDYPEIQGNPKVVVKYSPKYYWYLYRANNLISTEAPAHVNLLRSNNKYIKKALINTSFVFLQHGIIYMKNMDRKGAFSRGKEAEPSYMVVSSEKEKQIVSKMLKLPEDRLLNVGLPSFDSIQPNSIDCTSRNIVTIMLTWKPYEEHFRDFSSTSYYQNTVAIARSLKNRLHSSEVRIVAHPKVYEAISNTDLKGQLWSGKISEALKDTKLLITDYSSVCYNSFYRGAGIIFFQPDIAEYEKETGTLIPSDDEYIGRRCFSIIELRSILDEVIIDKEISLADVRTAEHEARYKEINQFSDGNNVDRLFSALSSLKIV